MRIEDLEIKEAAEIFKKEDVNLLNKMLAEGESTWSEPMMVDEILDLNNRIVAKAIAKEIFTEETSKLVVNMINEHKFSWGENTTYEKILEDLEGVKKKFIAEGIIH